MQEKNQINLYINYREQQHSTYKNVLLNETQIISPN